VLGGEAYSPAAMKCRSFGGHFGGQNPASAGRRELGSASVAGVLAAQNAYAAYSDSLVVHGKEKVYGSIP